jgi:O-antigen/teichoic acid export membrane protein
VASDVAITPDNEERTVKSLAVRNGLWNALANISGGLTALIGSVIIVRSLAPEAYGTFSYYMWLSSIFIVLGTLAFPAALTKISSELIGQDRGREATGLSIAVTLGVFALNLLIAAALVLWALSGRSEQGVLLLVMAGLIVPNSTGGVLLSIFWGQQRYKPVSLMFLIASSVQITLVVAAYFANWGIVGFLAASLSANTIQALGLFIILSKGVLRNRVKWASFTLPQRDTLRRYAIFALPATIAQICVMIVWERSEIFFLMRFSSITEIGYYSIAYTMFGMCMLLGWALVNGYLPSISHSFGAGDWTAIREKIEQGTILATLYSVPLSFGAIATVERIVMTVYGTKMAPAAPIAQILFAGLVPAVFACVVGLAVVAVGGVWLHVRLAILMSVANIVIALLVIPQFGAIGAAISNTGAQAIHVALFVIMAQLRYGITIPWQRMLQICFLGLVTTYLVPTLIQSWIDGAEGLVLAIALAGVAYGVTIWALGFLRTLEMADAEPQPVH